MMLKKGSFIGGLVLGDIPQLTNVWRAFIDCYGTMTDSSVSTRVAWISPVRVV